MNLRITKRDGRKVPYEPLKIKNAIAMAVKETAEMTEEDIDSIVSFVEECIVIHKDIDVETIQNLVEEELMMAQFPKTAKAYILYRDKQNQNRKRDIFKMRKSLKPYEYPELESFKEAIQHSYWLFSEFNYTSDVQDYKVNVTQAEREAIKRAMLAIAQVEVDVKEFWGNLYKRLPKPELANVGATFAESECYIEGTEILTPAGFKDFRDVNNGDLVAQYHSDGTITFAPATNKVARKANKLHHIHKSYLDAYVTPGHNMAYYKTKDATELTLRPSEELSGRNSSNYMPQSGFLQGEVDHLTDMERLYIAIQADGNYRTWTNKDGNKIDRGITADKQEYEISVKKDRKKERLLALLEKTGVQYQAYNEARDEYVRYRVMLDRDFNYKHFDWVDLSNKSHVWCEEFIQELVEWDGTRLTGKTNATMNYSTTLKDVANVVQSVGIGAGYRITVTDYEDKRKESYLNVYKMNFVSNKQRITMTYNKDEVDYDGMVYCVSVPSGVIITRLNGKMLIAGNCRHADAYANLLELLGLNGEFENIDEIPALNERITYLKKHNQYALTGRDKDYITAVLLFSSAIEHISLFSQFLIIMSFNKYKNLFSGVSNAIEATSKEEQLHGEFGVALVNVVREERPEWFNKELAEEVYDVFKLAYESENRLLDWIFEYGELDFLPKSTIQDFLKNRLNNSLESVGLERIFEVDMAEVNKTDWFDDEVVASSHKDFFYKRSTNYTKRSQSITADDLFG